MYIYQMRNHCKNYCNNFDISPHNNLKFINMSNLEYFIIHRKLEQKKSTLKSFQTNYFFFNLSLYFLLYNDYSNVFKSNFINQNKT